MTTCPRFNAAMRSLLLTFVMLPLLASYLRAQSYAYLPSGSTVDDRFLSLTGGGIQTLGDNPLVFKVASPACSSTVEIGVFDGETGGTFDQGSVSLIFALYADPEGDCTGTVKLGEWRGDAMNDNDWYTIIASNAPEARCGCGDYFYMLKVRSADPAAFHWSSFKLRSTGTIAVSRASNFTFSAPLGSALDAAVVYPSYPALTPTNYDGAWHFYMDVPSRPGAVAIWDGDFDRGSYDCSDNDTDDDDTPNTIPSWATGSAVAEGTASGGLLCQDAAGNAIGGTTTSNPTDDSRGLVFARLSGVSYDVVAPDGVRFTNSNPSGNLEWEQFNVSTEFYVRGAMDCHANELKAGIYEVAISGMDLGNLNAMRFPYDVAGVDGSGSAVMPIRPDYNDGSITGTIYYESGGNCTQGLLELGIPLATVRLAADYNGDGVNDETWSAVTDVLGGFCFNNLHPGAYVVTVDKATLALGSNVVCDSDGAANPHTVKGSLSMCSRSLCVLFGYKKSGLLGAL